MLQTISFWSFEKTCSGRLITHVGDYAVVQSRNPYGTHNLLLVEADHNGCGAEAIRHGSQATLLFVKQWLGQAAYRKVRKHLASKQVGLNWVLSTESE
ncbi:hypothetical protein [Diaphorobacter sp. J5-51]|uniref:hypothetical protein n=1 Tax=Diaphorobacter sp. J5-51 TaxID=680496 RepID=UPI000657B1ED|nr:hypothetical protein [Diaphorobacter sp. J5-51]KLR59471.1 hypothetical protein OX89_01550 [Diaphorobacter sp. J5-51]